VPSRTGTFITGGPAAEAAAVAAPRTDRGAYIPAPAPAPTPAPVDADTPPGALGGGTILPPPPLGPVPVTITGEGLRTPIGAPIGAAP
jgi:hypothetical protein